MSRKISSSIVAAFAAAVALSSFGLTSAQASQARQPQANVPATVELSATYYRRYGYGYYRPYRYGYGYYRPYRSYGYYRPYRYYGYRRWAPRYYGYVPRPYYFSPRYYRYY